MSSSAKAGEGDLGTEADLRRRLEGLEVVGACLLGMIEERGSPTEQPCWHTDARSIGPGDLGAVPESLLHSLYDRAFTEEKRSLKQRRERTYPSRFDFSGVVSDSAPLPREHGA